MLGPFFEDFPGGLYPLTLIDRPNLPGLFGHALDAIAPLTIRSDFVPQTGGHWTDTRCKPSNVEFDAQLEKHQ